MELLPPALVARTSKVDFHSLWHGGYDVRDGCRIIMLVVLHSERQQYLEAYRVASDLDIVVR